MADAALTTLGPRLRALRRSRDMSLTALGELTGISVSTLSRLESGQRRPQLELLLPIARALDTGLDELVGSGERDPRIRTRSRRQDGVIVTRLSRDGAGTYVAHMHYPARPGPVSPRVHEGRDWVYVLSGRLRLVLGEQDLVLEPGEAAEFPTTTPHWMGSTGAGAVDVLCIFGPSGEVSHLRSTLASESPAGDPASGAAASVDG